MKKIKNLLKDKLVRKIAKNSGIILGGNTAASVLGIVSFAVMASSLGPKLLAYFVLSQVYVGVINSLFNVQTWESLIKFGTKEDGSHTLGDVVKTNLLLDVIGATVAFVVAIVALEKIASFLEWDSTLIEVALLYSFVIPFTLTTLTIGIPRLYDKFLVVAKIQVALSVVKLALILLVSYTDESPQKFIAVYVITEILLNLALIIYSLTLLKRRGDLPWRSSKLYMTAMQAKFIWWTNLRTIVRIPVRQLDVVIISVVMSMEAVGVYKVYKEIVGVIGRLGEPLNQALYPEYSKLIGKRNSPETVSVTKKIMLLLILLSLGVMFFLVISAEFVVSKFFGEEYLIMIGALYILIALESINLFLTPINSLFVAAGFARYGFYIVLFTNVMYLLVALVAGQHYGIYGIILAFFLQMLFNQGLKLFLMMKFSSGWNDVVR